MKSRKKKVLSWMVAVALIGFGAAHARGEFIVDDWNWADSVVEYSANIQNYGGTVMSGSTTWWLTGPPDADVDGNGYAWDGCDQDSVAGWRAGDANQYITMYWKDGIADVAGNDLVISLYSGPKASATVWASVDGISFSEIGAIGIGTAGYPFQQYYDLNGLLDNTIHYVQVQRVTTGNGTGMFFDAFGAAPVPEPGAITVLATGLIALLALGRRYRASRT